MPQIGRNGESHPVTTIPDPLRGPPPKEVPLPNAPLVRVIAQVRFSPILSIGKPDFIASLQERLRETYPLLHPEETHSVFVAREGVTPGQRHVAWRFSDMKDAWRVSLAPTFIALETTRYTNRTEFVDRMRFILDALHAHVKPADARRVGLRYIDRIVGQDVTEITKLVRKEMLGIVNSPLFQHAEREFSETVVTNPATDEHLALRWGHLPPGVTVDPNAIEPVDELSWILDIDMFAGTQRTFAPEGLTKSIERFAERIYAVFRWAVTDEFLRRFGGKP